MSEIKKQWCGTCGAWSEHGTWQHDGEAHSLQRDCSAQRVKDLEDALRESLPLLEIVRDYEPGEPTGACAPNRARVLCDWVKELIADGFWSNPTGPKTVTPNDKISHTRDE